MKTPPASSEVPVNQTPAPAAGLSPAIEQAVTSWESATLTTLGPILSTQAYNALTAALQNLRQALTAATAAS
jgi:hypothetical protein